MLVAITNSWMPAMTAVAALLLSYIRASAQDVPPPPKPLDDGPSLEVTMKFIEEKRLTRASAAPILRDSLKASQLVNSRHPVTCRRPLRQPVER
jgi:hypothetical protein